MSRRGDGGRVAPEPPFPSAREGAVAPERAHRPCVFVAHRRIRRALPGALLAAVREGVLGSPLIGSSTLAGSFQGSRGFGVTFTGEGIPQLLERFGFLKPYWERVRAGPPERMLQSLRSRLSRPAPPSPNAFFLNLLMLGPGASVGRHVDATLAKPSGVLDATPRLVSVLYLRVPRGARGGELVLDDGARIRSVVRPREGHLIHFDGRLTHRVEPFREGPPDQARASLVLEQYHFAPEALARLPAFQVHSRAGFAAHLADHRQRLQAAAPARRDPRG